MIPVDQTTFGFPTGNCMSACVASLLHLPIDAVPWFNGAPDWFEALLTWLRPQGYYAFVMPYDENGYVPEGFYILGGDGPRGGHAVVARGRQIVHDPHPSRTGLVRREECTLVVPFDLACGTPCREARAVSP